MTVTVMATIISTIITTMIAIVVVAELETGEPEVDEEKPVVSEKALTFDVLGNNPSLEALTPLPK